MILSYAFLRINSRKRAIKGSGRLVTIKLASGPLEPLGLFFVMAAQCEGTRAFFCVSVLLGHARLISCSVKAVTIISPFPMASDWGFSQ